MQAGDIHAADLGEERLRRVLVLSDASFHRRSTRVVVVPEFNGPDTPILRPWRIQDGDAVFAVDHLRTIESGRLVDHIGRAPYGVVAQARRALLAIT